MIEKMINCKLCGRPLTSQESIKRGYGATCYRIHMNTQKLQKTDDFFEQIENIKTENTFLKMEIKMIKSQLKLIQTNTYTREEPIERIKREERKVEQKPMVNKMVEVMNTLREKFKIMHEAMGDVRSILDKHEEYETKEYVSLAELKRKKDEPIEIIEVR